MKELETRLLEAAAICFVVLIVFVVRYCYRRWPRRTPARVHSSPQELLLHLQPRGDGGAGNQHQLDAQQAGQGGDGNGAGHHHENVADPEQPAAQGVDGNGAVPEIQQVDPQQGGGGDQHLPVSLADSDLHHRNMLPGNDRNHDAPRTDKETTPAVGFFSYDAAEYGMSGKLNAKSPLYRLNVVLLKLLPRKKPCEQQNASSEPLLNAAG